MSEAFAVVQIAHRQYLVKPGETYTVDKFLGEPGDKLQLDVLAVAENDKFVVGTPLVDTTKVQVEILGQEKGEKVTTRLFRAKSRYRRTRGFRKQVTTFKVLNIK